MRTQQLIQLLRRLEAILRKAAPVLQALIEVLRARSRSTPRR
jgi:hypothetical protein